MWRQVEIIFFPYSQDGCILNRNKAKAQIFHQKLFFCFIDFFFFRPQTIKEERKVLQLKTENAFGIVQENKLTTVVSLLDHLTHAVNVVKALGCTGECGKILSLVLACSEHPYPKPEYLQLPLCFLVAPPSSLCHTDKVATTQLSQSGGEVWRCVWNTGMTHWREGLSVVLVFFMRLRRKKKKHVLSIECRQPELVQTKEQMTRHEFACQHMHGLGRQISLPEHHPAKHIANQKHAPGCGIQ